MSPAPRVVSLGSRLNIAESETIRTLLTGHDAVVVNSCAVTNAAVKETRAAIRRLWREAPGGRADRHLLRDDDRPRLLRHDRVLRMAPGQRAPGAFRG